MVTIRLLFEMIKYRSEFFNKSDRNKKPTLLTKGWNHAYAQLNVGNIMLIYLLYDL